MRLMRFAPKIHPIRAINLFFLSVLKSPSQIDFEGVINLEPNISCLDPLKVPKYENFHRTDFFYFYTIKPLWVGDFRAKIKNSKY